MYRVTLLSLLIVSAISAGKGEDGIQCRLCTSSDNVNCTSQPEFITLECKGEKCYSYIDGTTTRRGCTEPTGGCKPGECIECVGEDLCNSKIVPEDRQLCFQCEGLPDCSTTTSLKALACKNYKKDDKCFTYVSDDKQVARGCESDDLKSCSDDAKNCLKCPSSGCNSEPAVSQVTCYNCTSEEEKICKRPANADANCMLAGSIKTCTSDVLLGRDPQCFTYSEAEIVRRGCGNGDGLSSAQTCNKEKCNSECVLDATCQVCDASQCKGDQMGTSTKCGEYVSSCNHCETLDLSSTIRSCGGDSPKDYICKSCHGENCNKQPKLPKMCYVCDSNTDSKCAKNENIKSEFCEDVSHQCMVKLGEDGSTTRSCAPASACPSNDASCAICDKHNCNTQVLTQEQTMCFRCNDTGSCADEQKAPGTLCSKSGDQCYMFSKDEKEMQRGCMSDRDVPSECTQGKDTCAICNRDNCNSLPVLGKSGLTCIHCNISDTACPWRQTADKSGECLTPMLYYKQELCYTLQRPGDKVERGCLSETKDCTLGSRNCRICYDSVCNTESTKSWSCVQCRSDFYGEEGCKNENPDIAKTECSRAPTEDTRGCYTENYGGATIRGCLSNLDSVDFNFCKTSNQCEICTTENCNIGKTPNGSNSVMASSFITVCVALLSFKLF